MVLFCLLVNLVLAQPYYHRSLEALVAVDPKGVRPCIPLLFKAVEYVIRLPNPAQAFVDYQNRRILFSVDPADIGQWPRVDQTEQMNVGNGEATQIKIEALKSAPLKNIWIDVTSGIPFSQKIFDLYDLGPPISKYECIHAAAAVSGITTIDNLRSEDFFTLQPYLEKNFYEIDARQRDQAEVAYVFRTSSRAPLSLRTSHAFIPIPNTEWAFHKSSLSFPRLQKISDILKDWPGLVRYFSRRVDLNSLVEPKWFNELTQEQNRIRHEAKASYGLSLQRVVPRENGYYWHYALRPPHNFNDQKPQMFEFKYRDKPIWFLQFSDMDYVFAFKEIEFLDLLKAILKALQLYRVESYNEVSSTPVLLELKDHNGKLRWFDQDAKFLATASHQQNFSILRMTTTNSDFFRQLITALDQVMAMDKIKPSVELITTFAKYESLLRKLDIKKTDVYWGFRRKFCFF